MVSPSSSSSSSPRSCGSRRQLGDRKAVTQEDRETQLLCSVVQEERSSLTVLDASRNRTVLRVCFKWRRVKPNHHRRTRSEAVSRSFWSWGQRLRPFQCLRNVDTIIAFIHIRPKATLFVTKRSRRTNLNYDSRSMTRISSDTASVLRTCPAFQPNIENYFQALLPPSPPLSPHCSSRQLICAPHRFPMLPLSLV